MTPTGSWPRIRPGLTGYSPRTMWTSVPQIVVAVIRMTASPAPGVGFADLFDGDLVLALENNCFHRFHGVHLVSGS